MRVGMMGLGKLGLPVALAIEAAGHHVHGYDPNPAIATILQTGRLPYLEEGADELLERTGISLWSSDALAQWADVVFVAVQTPHEPLYEGVTPLPQGRADFDYGYLTDAVQQLVLGAVGRQRPLTIAVISTVLPGTIDRHVRPLLSEHVRLVYTPQFIAMGTTIRDFTDPEFVLLGVSDTDAANQVERLFATITDAPVRRMSVTSAELTKVAYNTFITAKVTIANLLAQIADVTGAHVDEVTDALAAAHRRILSPTYMRAGMGDGGGCHPRDNIALSWFAREHGLPDLFTGLMRAREDHCAWLAEMTEKAAADAGLPIVIMGRAYKRGTNLTVGSPATLLANLLIEADVAQWDPCVDETAAPAHPAVYVVATDHDDFRTWKWPAGSIVIDPWGIVDESGTYLVIRPGRGS